MAADQTTPPPTHTELRYRARLRALISKSLGIDGVASRLWNSPWFGALLWCSAAYFGCWDLYHHTPQPGVAVGALAVVAGVMSVRDLKGFGRISWTCLLVLLLRNEYRAISETARQAKEDLKTQDTNFETILKRENNDFKATAASLSTAYGLAQKQFSLTTRKSDRILGSIETDLDAVTGSNSYPYWIVLSRPEINGTFELSFTTIGKYPMRGISVTISTVDSVAQGLSAPKDPTCSPCFSEYILKRERLTHRIQLREGDDLPYVAHPIREYLPLGIFDIDTYSTAGLFNERLTLSLDNKGDLQQKVEVQRQGKHLKILSGGKFIIPRKHRP